MKFLTAARMRSGHEDVPEHERCAPGHRGLVRVDRLQWERAYLWSIWS